MKKAIPAVTAQEKHLYLDYAATAPLSNSTIAFLTPLLSAYGNPSSPHSVGEAAKEIVSKARRNVARFLNAPYDCVFFTAGGAAGNALGILGYAKKHGGPILYSPTAHKSILACMEGRTDSKPLKVDRNGFLDLSYLRACLTGCASPPLVVTEYANSEIGSIQDVRQIIALTHRANGAVFLDCTGSISTIPLDVSELDVDMAAFSAHKLGGLKGCGAFYKKKSISIEPLIYGSQEQGLIGGTENVLGIASLGKVAKTHDYSLSSPKNRDAAYRFFMRHVPGCRLVGSLKNRLAHNLYLCFLGVEGESLMMALDANGIQVSTGSACGCGDGGAPPALAAIGMDPDDMHSCIRITFGGQETTDDIAYLCETAKRCVRTLRSMNKAI